MVHDEEATLKPIVSIKKHTTTTKQPPRDSRRRSPNCPKKADKLKEKIAKDQDSRGKKKLEKKLKTTRRNSQKRRPSPHPTKADQDSKRVREEVVAKLTKRTVEILKKKPITKAKDRTEGSLKSQASSKENRRPEKETQKITRRQSIHEGRNKPRQQKDCR